VAPNRFTNCSRLKSIGIRENYIHYEYKDNSSHRQIKLGRRQSQDIYQAKRKKAIQELVSPPSPTCIMP